MSTFDIVKAGWLFRESSILKRWKRHWFVLYASGELKYFESQDRYEEEESFNVPIQVVYLEVGEQCENVVPPTGLNENSLFTVCLNDGRKLQLCGESPDDAGAWRIALEQARAVSRSHSAPPLPSAPYYPNISPYPSQGTPPPMYTPVHPNSPYMYRTPSQGYAYEYPQQQYVVNQNGDRVVYLYDARRRRRGDFATGALAGAAVGSLLFWPLLLW